MARSRVTCAAAGGGAGGDWGCPCDCPEAAPVSKSARAAAPKAAHRGALRLAVQLEFGSIVRIHSPPKLKGGVSREIKWDKERETTEQSPWLRSPLAGSAVVGAAGVEVRRLCGRWRARADPRGKQAGHKREALQCGQGAQSLRRGYRLACGRRLQGLMAEMTNRAVCGGIAVVILPGFTSLADVAGKKQEREERCRCGQ